MPHGNVVSSCKGSLSVHLYFVFSSWSGESLDVPPNVACYSSEDDDDETGEDDAVDIRHVYVMIVVS